MPSDMNETLRDTSTSSDIDYALINTSISLEIMTSDISYVLRDNTMSSDINYVLRNMSLEITMPSEITCIRRYPKVL